MTRRRCNEPDCKASARDKTNKCIAHGGGKRCSEPDCKASAVGKSDKCVAHGGGKRCNELDCKASAQGNSIVFFYYILKILRLFLENKNYLKTYNYIVLL